MLALLTRSLGKESLKAIRYIHRTPGGASSGLYPPTEDVRFGLGIVNPEPWARGGLRGVVGPLGVVCESAIAVPCTPCTLQSPTQTFRFHRAPAIEAGGLRNAKVDLDGDGEQRGDAMENAHKSV
jgi:hypothetical protein